MGTAAQRSLREAHQHAFELAQRCTGGLIAEAQPLLHIYVKVFKQRLAGIQHCIADLASKIVLQLVKS